MVHLPLYSAVTAALLMFLQVFLMLLVGFARARTKQSIGDGGNPELLLSIRRHANLTESAPIFVLVLAFAEIFSGSSIVILSLGVAFVAVRIAHAVGLTMGAGANAPRAVGALGTVLLSLGATLHLLWLVSSHA